MPSPSLIKSFLPLCRYFLLGVARMSEDALNRATRINDLLADWRSQMAGQSTNTPLRMVDLLAANPFLPINQRCRQLNLAFTTAQRAIERLERNGIVQQVSDAKRDRVYCAQALLAILEEPAHM
jgi:Fic family protein